MNSNLESLFNHGYTSDNDSNEEKHTGERKEEEGEGRIEESEREERSRRGQEGGWGRGVRAGGTMGKRGIGADRGRDL